MKDFTKCVLGFQAILALFVQPTAYAEPILYATNMVQLYTLSRTHASATFIGSFGVLGYMAGFAYDAGNDILYGSTTATDNLYSINRATGSATLIGPFGIPLMHALAFDNSTGTLYGAYGGNNGFYRINPFTGAATLIGVTGFAVSGLAFDPATKVLYGTSYSPGDTRLLQIDPADGRATPIATLALTGISFDPETGVLYGITNGALGLPHGLYTVDIPTGTASLVGPLSLDNPLDLQFVLGQVVPEPRTLMLIGIGMVGLLGYAYRRQTISDNQKRRNFSGANETH
jgi:hypothetical protein